MADKTIDEAEAVTSVSGSETFPASVGGAAKKVTTDQLKSYVVAAMAALADVTGFGSGDGIMVRKDGTNGHITLDTLTDAVFGTLIGKSAASNLIDADKLIVRSDGVQKTLVVGDLKNYIAAAFTGNMDIHGLTAADASATSDELAAYQTPGGGEAGNRKVTVAQLSVPICAQVPSAATVSTTAIGDTDGILIARAPTTAGGSPTLERVPLQNAGIKSTGDVKGPATTTVNKIPQWNTTTKDLKDGMTVVTGVGSGSLDTEVPTALAVQTALTAAAGNKMNGLTSSTDGDIVMFNGTDGKTVKGGVNITSTIRSLAQASDSTLPTERAVRAALPSGNLAEVVNLPAENAIPFFPTASRYEIDAQNLFKTTTVREATLAVDNRLPTEKAVATYVEEQAGIAVGDAILHPPASTDGYIPKWNGTDGKNLVDGYGVCTSIREPSEASNYILPTEKAVASRVATEVNYYIGCIKTTNTQPVEGESGERPYVLIYYNNKLYLNVGDESYAHWKTFTAD